MHLRRLRSSTSTITLTKLHWLTALPRSYLRGRSPISHPETNHEEHEVHEDAPEKDPISPHISDGPDQQAGPFTPNSYHPQRGAFSFFVIFVSSAAEPPTGHRPKVGRELPLGEPGKGDQILSRRLWVSLNCRVREAAGSTGGRSRWSQEAPWSQ